MKNDTNLNNLILAQEEQLRLEGKSDVEILCTRMISDAIISKCLILQMHPQFVEALRYLANICEVIKKNPERFV